MLEATQYSAELGASEDIFNKYFLDLFFVMFDLQSPSIAQEHI